MRKFKYNPSKFKEKEDELLKLEWAIPYQIVHNCLKDDAEHLNEFSQKRKEYLQSIGRYEFIQKLLLHEKAEFVNSDSPYETLDMQTLRFIKKFPQFKDVITYLD